MSDDFKAAVLACGIACVGAVALGLLFVGAILYRCAPVIVAGCVVYLIVEMCR